MFKQVLSYSYWSGFSGLEDRPEELFISNYSLKSDDDKKA